MINQFVKDIYNPNLVWFYQISENISLYIYIYIYIGTCQTTTPCILDNPISSYIGIVYRASSESNWSKLICRELKCRNKKIHIIPYYYQSTVDSRTVSIIS